MVRRLLVASLLALLTAGVAAGPAVAGDGGPRPGGGRISFDGGLLVGAAERVDGVVISVDGDVDIEGVVDGDVYVGGGDVTVTGRVRDDIVVISGDVVVENGVDGDILVLAGRAIIRDGAFVQGDIRSTTEPRIARGADVSGDVDKLGVRGFFGGLMFTLLALLWLAVTVSGALIGLVFVLAFPGAADASVRAAGNVGSSIAWGLGVVILGPVVVVLALATVIGLPFGLSLGAALTALGALGYVTSALCLGRTMVKGPGTGSRIGAFFAGLGILRAVAIIPGIGAIVGLGATVYGLGVLVVAARRASRPPVETAGADEGPTTAVTSDTGDS